MLFSCDFELDPARMDLLNLSDRIFGEFVHALDMDSRCRHRRRREICESRFPTAFPSYLQTKRLIA